MLCCCEKLPKHRRDTCISNNVLREFEIKETRYANYRYAVVGEIAISLPTLFCSKGMVSYPELSNLQSYLLHLHRSEDALAKP